MFNAPEHVQPICFEAEIGKQLVFLFNHFGLPALSNYA